MNKKENVFFKVWRYFLLTCVISFGFISIVATGGSLGVFEWYYPITHRPDLETAPNITEIILYDSNWVEIETYSFDIGEYYNYKVSATDPNGDIVSLVITQYHPDYSDIPYYGPNFISLPSVSYLTYYSITPIEVTGPSGSWAVKFQIEDSKGNESGWWKFYYTVN
jgi:hypothetical protein